MSIYAHIPPLLPLPMPAHARKHLIPNGADCLVHTISRCVRRAWLCGLDPYSGKNFDHRREWVRDRAKSLVSFFAVEVLAYAVMSNHSHFVLWVRPSVAAGWSAEEVARRWLSLFGKRVDGPTDKEIAQAAANPKRIALWRGRLGDVSWFMRCLNEWLARKANAEDECKGRFWEGRFRCQLLEDAGAVLACMAYVDLNPVRAKAAGSLEESRLTSIHDRIRAKRARRQLEAMGAGKVSSRADAEARDGEEMAKSGQDVRPVKGKAASEPTDAQARMLDDAREEAECDGWLCRFGDEVERAEKRDEDASGPGGGGFTAVPGGPMPEANSAGPGAHTVLAMRFAGYLGLLDWTGRCVAHGKAGSLPEAAMPVLERMELDVGNWVETVERYGSLYHRVAGKVENLKRKAKEMGQQWVAGQRKSGWVFRRRGAKRE